MALDHDLAALFRAPIFAEFDPEGLRLIAFSAEAKNMSRGEYVFYKGEEASGAYIVAQGSVGLFQDDSAEVYEEVLYAGALLGEIALIVPVLRPVTARVMEPSQLLEIPRTLIMRVFKEFPTSAARVLRYYEMRT